MPPFFKIKHLCVELPKSLHRRTLIFDLDETLIYCLDDDDDQSFDFHVQFKSEDETEPIDAYINLRPGALECLRYANHFFQVVVFTAAEQQYADAILDYLDPNYELIQARYYRDSCFSCEGILVKDLRIFQKDLKDLAIIDNNITAFAFHLDNGVPMTDFMSDRDD